MMNKTFVGREIFPTSGVGVMTGNTQKFIFPSSSMRLVIICLHNSQFFQVLLHFKTQCLNMTFFSAIITLNVTTISLWMSL